jgi:hypothetical protein
MTDNIKVGMKIKGNINGVIIEVVKIENNTIVFLKDLKTGRICQYGLEALKRCNISIIEQ